MTNLEKILEMKQKVESMNIEVTKGIEVQKKAIDECRKEKAIALFNYFEGLRKAIGADNDWDCGINEWINLDGKRFVLRIDKRGISIAEDKMKMSDWGENYQLTEKGVTKEWVYKFVDAWRDEYKTYIENMIAESIRKKLQKNIDNLKEIQKKTNDMSELYGLEVK